MGRQSPLTQAMDLQAIAMTAARDPNVAPHIKAALMRAWTDLQDVIMAIRGHGRPKPVEARNATPKRKVSGSAPIVYPAPGPASQGAVIEDKRSA